MVASMLVSGVTNDAAVDEVVTDLGHRITKFAIKKTKNKRILTI